MSSLLRGDDKTDLCQKLGLLVPYSLKNAIFVTDYDIMSIAYGSRHVDYYLFCVLSRAAYIDTANVVEENNTIVICQQIVTSV